MMKLIRITAAFLLLGAFAEAGVVESPAVPPRDQNAGGKQESFSLVPPKHWSVNIQDANAKGMYAYMLMDGYTYETSPALIYVRIMDKMGVGVDEHLKADMNDSRRNNADVSFHRFKIDNMKYPHAARKYRYGKTSCDYLCYIDPGKDDPSYLIFVLSTDYKHCNSYTEEFRTVLRSFLWSGRTGQATRN